MQYLKEAITINSLIYSVFLHSCRFGRQLWFWHDNRDIQWNMGISLRTWIINVTFCGKLLFKNILADWLRQRAALMALEKKIPHIPILCKKRKRRFPFAFSTFLEQLDKKREGIYEKGFTKDSTQPHNHRRIAKRLVTKPSIISEEKKKRKNLSSVLVSNGYSISFLQKLTKTGKPNNNAEPANEFKATAVLPLIMSKVCSNSFAVAYNDKTNALFSSRRLR